MSATPTLTDMNADAVYMGWAVRLNREPWLYVQYGGDEAEAWFHALGWPSDDEIEWAKKLGARAFPVEIKEVRSKSDMTPPLTPAQRRALTWLPENCSWRKAQYDSEIWDLVECQRVQSEYVECDGFGNWRLTPSGVARVREIWGKG